MSSRAEVDVDVVVAGGGPAGATLATLVSMQGHRVLLLDRATFPRHRVGESLLPPTVHGICRLTGAAAAVERAGFPVTRGLRWEAGPGRRDLSYGSSRRLHRSATTGYQVDRSVFDQILVDTARRQGVEVREGCTVTGVLERGGRVGGLVYHNEQGQPREVRAQYVVDASGHDSPIAARVGARRAGGPEGSGVALFGYLEAGPATDAETLMAAYDFGWLWHAPLGAGRAAVGALLRRDPASTVDADGPPARRLAGLLTRSAAIAERLAGAGPVGAVEVRRDVSYARERLWRPGMMLVGDAAGPPVPVLTSGVHLASYGALLAARSINTALLNPAEEVLAFVEFEARYRAEYARCDELLDALWDLAGGGGDARTYSGGTLAELASGVGSGDTALLDVDSYLKRRDPAPAARWNGAVEPDLAAEPDEPEEGALPVRDGGLVPSSDGMRWKRPA